MIIDIKEIKDKKTWEEFFLNIEEKTFLNSWTWTLFRESMQEKIFRKGIYVNNSLFGIFFISKIESRKGSFFLLAHNPIIKQNSDDVLNEVLKEIKILAKKEKVSFIRIAPIWKENSIQDEVIKNFGAKFCFSKVYPEKSWELNLNQSEDIILSKMRKGTRYMINKGLKNKDFVVSKIEKGNINDFYTLYEKTASRHNFVPFSYKYIEKEFNFFSEEREAVIILIKNKNEYIAGAFIVFWQGVAFYHHGASLNDKEYSSASYLAQWEAIKEAKKRNCKKYNFWVISPVNDSNHRWAGLTFFKKGFGGYETNYAKTKDIPLSKKYWLTYFFERIKK